MILYDLWERPLHEELIWFISPDCDYCTELDPHVQEFAKANNLTLRRVEAGILDETGEPQVPALLMHSDSRPKANNLLIVGRFCLEALRWHLRDEH